MGQLEPLQAVAALSLLTDTIEDGIYQLSSLSVVTLCPVITRSALACMYTVKAKLFVHLLTLQLPYSIPALYYNNLAPL